MNSVITYFILGDPLIGNLNWRKDGNLKENFTYDNLLKNRLETWQVNTGTAYGVNYANNGNINTKTGLGTFSYNAPQPHAVAGIENTGNLVSEMEQIVRYTPFNKVDTIREGNYRLEITYGPDQARKITRLYNNNVLEKTKYYVGGNYEVEIDGSGNERKLHYIYGGDGLASQSFLIMPFKRMHDNLIVKHFIDNAVLLVYSARPTTSEVVF